MSKILVAGTAGFIGFHLFKRLLERGHEVIGLDNLNDYSDVRLKHDRLKQLEEQAGFSFVKMGLEDRDGITNLFASVHFDKVVNLTAQAGVRYSIQNLHAYIDSNIVGFLNILEGCCHNDVKHLAYVFSNSVYDRSETGFVLRAMYNAI